MRQHTHPSASGGLDIAIGAVFLALGVVYLLHIRRTGAARPPLDATIPGDGRELRSMTTFLAGLVVYSPGLGLIAAVKALSDARLSSLGAAAAPRRHLRRRARPGDHSGHLHPAGRVPRARRDGHRAAGLIVVRSSASRARRWGGRGTGGIQAVDHALGAELAGQPVARQVRARMFRQRHEPQLRARPAEVLVEFREPVEHGDAAPETRGEHEADPRRVGCVASTMRTNTAVRR